MRIIAIGSFDGIHLGHAAVIDAALAAGSNVSVICFEPVPRQYFGMGSWRRRLTTALEREEALTDLGVKRVLIHSFDETTVNLEPGQFLDQLHLRECFNKLVVGYDFHFGRDRAGTGQFLTQWCTSRDIDAIIVPPLKFGGEPVKSERIRKLLSSGRISEAESLLGRSYSLTGVVARGKGFGRSIGFPTLNVRVPLCKMLPEAGSYAGTVEIGSDRNRIPAAVFVPRDHDAPVEAHALAEIGSHYGKAAKVALSKRLREVVDTSSFDELSKLIAKDVNKVRQLSSKERWMEDPGI